MANRFRVGFALLPLARPVLAVMPRKNAGGQWAQILEDQAAHEAFYRTA